MTESCVYNSVQDLQGASSTRSLRGASFQILRKSKDPYEGPEQNIFGWVFTGSLRKIASEDLLAVSMSKISE